MQAGVMHRCSILLQSPVTCASFHIHSCRPPLCPSAAKNAAWVSIKFSAPLQKPSCARRSGLHKRSTVITAASGDAPAQQAFSLLKLSMPFATEFGDTVALVSSRNDWSLAEAVPLTWTEGDIWRGEVQAQSGLLEYKYLIRRGEEVSEWQPGSNLQIEVPQEPSVLYIEDRWLSEDRKVQIDAAALGSGTQEQQQLPTAAPVDTPTPKDEAAVATAAAAASPAAAAQQPTAAEPDSGDAAVAAERGNSLGKPLAKHTVKELQALLKAAKLPVSGKKQELITRLIEEGGY